MALPEYGNKMKEEKISNFCIKKNNFNEMKSNELCFQPAIPMYHYPVFFYICPHLWPCSNYCFHHMQSQGHFAIKHAKKYTQE